MLSIPGWSALDALPLPTTTYKRRVTARSVFEALLITLYCEAGTRARMRLDPAACSTGSFSRDLHTWLATPASDMGLPAKGKASALHAVWRGYLAMLTAAEVQDWQRRLEAQATSWRDAKRAPRLASRVHSPWFHAIFAVTNRKCGRPPIEMY